jgi:hypothetical protein
MEKTTQINASFYSENVTLVLSNNTSLAISIPSVIHHTTKQGFSKQTPTPSKSTHTKNEPTCRAGGKRRRPSSFTLQLKHVLLLKLFEGQGSG